jgi:hypothetical protein
MNTLPLPPDTTPPTCGVEPETNGHRCVSTPARQAGLSPISTSGLPAPGASGVPWSVGSPTRAAAGILPP